MRQEFAAECASFCGGYLTAQVQLQAHYHHCGEAASEKCLSAATFVRRRGRPKPSPRLVRKVACYFLSDPCSNHPTYAIRHFPFRFSSTRVALVRPGMSILESPVLGPYSSHVSHATLPRICMLMLSRRT